MDIESANSLEDVLDRYFAPYEDTLKLVAELVAARKHAAEILILLCARIDALASEASPLNTSSKKSFVEFIQKYGGNRDLLRSISLGDVYYEIRYHQWMLPGMIPEPGRLYRFTELNDPILHLLEDAGLPLTEEDSERLLNTLARLLSTQFKVKPYQPRAKPKLATVTNLEAAITNAFASTRLRKIAPNLSKAMRPLFKAKQVATILYEKFRCESIHGTKVIYDQKSFFTKEGIYWNSLTSEFYGNFELIEFSASFLVSLLKRCIKSYRNHLLARGKLPLDVHFLAYGDAIFDQLTTLDDDLIPEQGRMQLKFNGR